MNFFNSQKIFVAAVACSAALAGCDSITTADDAPTIERPAGTVVIGGSVTGLGATRPVELSMVTANNGLNDGTKVFSIRGTEVLRFGAVAEGASYNVSITRQPKGRTCSLQNGSGTATTEVSNITVTCVRDDTALYTLTAAIAPALAAAPPAGFAVTLTTEEGTETIQPAVGQTSVTFALPVFYPESTSPPAFNYTVSATNTVGGTTNKCLVTGATGSLVDTDAVTPGNVATGITVTSCLYTISVVAQYSAPPGGAAAAMGTGGLQLALRNQLTGAIVLEAPLINAYGVTPVAFPGTFASNSQALYEVVVQSHPAGQFCIVQGGGMAQLVTANSNVTTQVRCRDVPATANQLKGTYQLDTPPLNEVGTDAAPLGSLLLEPRLQTRNFLTFFADGTFLYGTHLAAATAGVEHGFYNYDPVAGTIGFTVWTDTNGSGGPVTFNPTFTEGSPAVSWSQGLSGRAGYTTAITFNFTTFLWNVVLPGNVTATNVVKTTGAPGTPGRLSMQFGTFVPPPVAPATAPAANLNPVWTFTEPVSTAGQIQGVWATADSKRVFVYNNVTYYGFHAGVNGAPNLQDACFPILDVRVAEGFYTRRGGDTQCMAVANAELGTVAVATVDVPNATASNTTAPLIPGFIGRLPGALSNAVSSPSPVLFKVEAGTPDTLTLQNTLNNNPIHEPVVLKRHTTY